MDNIGYRTGSFNMCNWGTENNKKDFERIATVIKDGDFNNIGYRFGSFNMCNWGSGNNKKNFERIATVIKDENFDIIAFQEVLSEDAVRGFVRRCLCGWDYSWASPVSYSNNASEGYAFVWNPKRIKPVVTEINGVQRVFEPRILNQYKIDRSSGQEKLIRNPYFGRFTPSGCGGCFAEFRLINTHINFGKKNNVDDSVGAVAQRNKEYEILSKAIYPKYADKRYGNNMPAYTIILGDYNLCLKESGCGPYLYPQNETVCIYDNGKEKRIETKQSDKTTVSNSEDGENVYAHNYDHFSYDTVIFDQHEISIGISSLDLIKKYFDNDKNKYVKHVSDHIPIAMNIDF